MADKFQAAVRNGAEQARDYSFESFISQPVRRLALVTPWSGGNLGNSAILSAVILNLSRRIASIEFIGVTLSCEQTVRRFGIEAFPLTGANPSYQAQCDSGKSDRCEKSTRARIKECLKRLPLVSNLLRRVNTIVREIRHILAASRIVRSLDCVLVAGGGALDEFWGGSWGHPWNLLKWSALSRIHGVPFAFLSVGKCSLERSTSRLFVKVALRLACYRSYRDPDSKNAVQSLINASDDPVVPDLAFSYPLPDLQNRRTCSSLEGRLVIGFSPIAYCDPRVWPLKDEERYARYLRQLSGIVKWLLKDGHQLIFFATDSPDLETIKDLFAAIADFKYDPRAILTLPGPVEQTIDGHLQGIGGADFVVASRLHGVILSHVIALPVIAISFDPKVDAHMASINQMKYCMDINTFTLDGFVERFEKLKAARRCEQMQLRSAVEDFRRQVDFQYDRIFGSEIRLNNRQLAELSAAEVAAQNDLKPLLRK
ncbi:MAG TPA: polysaccharide pyruvyl transferase family protein [Verrucomicrobiae bacterium]|nr:polysaccharide pyruvyl transferase family protein [Verrucomicrobiae bacterium]